MEDIKTIVELIQADALKGDMAIIEVVHMMATLVVKMSEDIQAMKQVILNLHDRVRDIEDLYLAKTDSKVQ
jgi:hypothetical protein